MIRNSVLQSSRRRLVVQLASLVDLLFVILFLQYMQLRLVSHRQAVAEKELRTQAEAAAKDAQGVTNQVVRNLDQLQNANRQLTEDLRNAEKQIKGLEGKSKEVARLAEEELLFVAKAAQDMLGVDIAPALKNASPGNVEAVKIQLASCGRPIRASSCNTSARPARSKNCARFGMFTSTRMARFGSAAAISSARFVPATRTISPSSSLMLPRKPESRRA